jgi:hypothetical protein
MGMKARVMPMLAVAAALLAPAAAFAGGAITQARAVSGDPANFDGARVRPEGELVRAGGSTDARSADQIARDEQVKADARMRANTPNLAAGPDKEIVPPKPSEWLKSDHIIMGVKGAMIGLLVGSLWGFAGLGIGILVGGLIGYGLSRLTA